MSLTVADVMVSPAITVPEAATYRQIVAALWEHGVSGLPVVDGAGRVVGVVTESDLVLREEFPSGSRNQRWAAILSELGRESQGPLLRALQKAQAEVARGLMTSPAITVRPGAELAAAARLLDRHRVRRLVVVDVESHPIGVVTRSDLLKAFLRHDDVILAEVNAILPPGLTVAVREGVVQVGHPGGGPRLTPAVLDRLQEVPGVVAVEEAVRVRPDVPRAATANRTPTGTGLHFNGAGGAVPRD